MAAEIEARFTSRSGFMSYYSNSLQDWLSKPVADWDHNELGTLLAAMYKPEERNEVAWSLIESSEVFWQAYSDSIDWAAFDAKVAELRTDKEQEQKELDPNYVAPAPRCQLTKDMFRSY